ncbi:helix-turn-helix transcriptional regulator [Paenibacillus harenae]|uniref:DNA-binding transcriptional regulator YafY n=1 Tax=Paenibacillus harenae TaxID=306543 RepID=A0ABT9U6V6_PAEHA|nr:YafY family protein [Paenibacillus harenae]MDQ0114179.1 putative DNA-binding transcriptional regulator YafY [Paenibacillus harenae]
MKWDRLLGITMELMAKKRVTATELADRFEVSTRTVYRDVELINQAGIPVVSFTGTDGGFELMNGYFLSKQHFSVEDFSVIYNLLRGVEGAVGGRFTAIMNKLGSLQPAVLNSGNQHPVIFDVGTTESERAIIGSLHQSVKDQRVVAFSYTTASGSIADRQAEPIQLFWERGAWYLEAYCLWRKAKRYFRTSRIAGLIVTDSVFQPREHYEEEGQEEVQGTRVQLRFDLTAQPRVFEQFPGVCSLHGTYIDVDTVFYSTDYAISVILSFGAKAEIVSPSSLKAELLEQIDLIKQRYSQQGG